MEKFHVRRRAPWMVMFADNAIGNSSTDTGGTYSTAMPSAAGAYSYQCTIHPGMNGSVTVQ